MRLFTTTAKQALDMSRVKMCFLVQVNIFKPFGENAGETLILTFSTAPYTMTFPVLGFPADQEWLGAGRMLDIDFAEEDSSSEVHNAEVTLNGLDVPIVSLALNENLERATVRFFMALYDPDTNQPIGQATQIFYGTMSNVRIIPPTGDRQ